MLANASGASVSIVSVTAEPKLEGAKETGWAIFRVAGGTTLTAFTVNDGDEASAQYAKKLVDVTGSARTLPGHSTFGPDVALYVRFVMAEPAVYKTAALRIVYRQSGKLFFQTFRSGYLFGTAPKR
jgi:hypothetical protein